jgi:hypothetical protein
MFSALQISFFRAASATVSVLRPMKITDFRWRTSDHQRKQFSQAVKLRKPPVKIIFTHGT